MSSTPHSNSSRSRSSLSTNGRGVAAAGGGDSSSESSSDDDSIVLVHGAAPSYFIARDNDEYDPLDEHEDNEEAGDGGGSDVEGDEIDDLDDAVRLQSLYARNRVAEHLDHDDIPPLMGGYDSEEDEDYVAEEDEDYDPGAGGGLGLEKNPYELSYHKPDPEWRPPARKRGEPAFEDVDNPGNWPPFCYQSKFNKQGKY